MKNLSGYGYMITAILLVMGEPALVADDRADFFESKIRPVLVGTCFRCHGDTKTSGDLRLDSRSDMLKGGESGPAIVPGDPGASLLIRAIQRLEDVSAMPPGKDKALRPDQVEDFVTWVRTGAEWPEKSAKFETSRHWAFEPLGKVMIPEVRNKAWVRNPIDAFVLAKQESKGLQPGGQSDKLALIRRATFDLTGLPAAPSEIDAFLADSSASAFDKVVDRLLKSPAYGERWGRHWLDVVRYADTAGETADYPVPLAWRYRNYVINSFNADKPYDEFVREQIAGDILAEQGGPENYAERVTATGYLAISRRFGFDSENYHHLTIQDTIDTVGQSVLGLSLGCARCHDHKFDPVSVKDYYGLYGIFDSTRYAFPGSEQKQKVRSMLPLVSRAESGQKWREYREKIAALSGQIGDQNSMGSGAILRSLFEIDGDFELQAPAAGGSNGVLVSPWLYEGQVALTSAAQSPYRNFYSTGKVGVSLPEGVTTYKIRQAIYPKHDGQKSGPFYLNLDFRMGPRKMADANGKHGFQLGDASGKPVVELLFAAESLSLRTGNVEKLVAPLKSSEWYNLQLKIDLNQRSLSLKVGVPGSVSEVLNQPIPSGNASAIELLEFRSEGSSGAKWSSMEFDNLGLQEQPIPNVSKEIPGMANQAGRIDVGGLQSRLKLLSGIDGDCEMQVKGSPPSAPWNSGPNSVVKISDKSQSPFQNIYPMGTLGLQMPNRSEYDGLGMSLTTPKTDDQGRLHIAFDFRCASTAAGGGGSWRYYIGHGPGNSAAVELYFNGTSFFQRSGDAREAVAPIQVGQWYQVQIILNTREKTYTGSISSASSKSEFKGKTSTGWDGVTDYTFVDSYGHLGGVRPALDFDNFTVGERALPALSERRVEMAQGADKGRRAEVSEIRKKLAEEEMRVNRLRQELAKVVVEGPVAMTYGVVEGTPHNAKIQVRGEPDKPGLEVPRSFVKVLGGETLPPAAKGSGRLELAYWLTRADNPLTARVMANRIWQYHFGRGLVGTPNDFGLRGLPPSHPELLDYLASEFIRSGWSMKAMHKRIMLSATYQESTISADSATTDAIGDTSDLYLNFTRRRLSAEEIRDAILAVSGELDRTPGQEHPFPAPNTWGFSQHGPFSAAYDHNKRSVYLMTQRLKRHPFLGLFDGADPNTTTASRLVTTVPTQALFFLNDAFVHEKSEKWASRLIKEQSETARRIEKAWRTAIGRSPSSTEEAEAVAFLSAYGAELGSKNLDQIEMRSLAAYLRTILGSNAFLFLD